MCPVCQKELTDPYFESFCSKKCYFKTLKVPVKVVWERDDHLCHLCGDEVQLDEASRDHLIPRAHGGPTTFENVALAHKKCNSRRGTKPVAEVKHDRARKRSDKGAQEARAEIS